MINRYVSPSQQASMEDSIDATLGVQPSRAAYVEAATAVVVQSRRFDDSDLLRYLADLHPEIPREHRLPLLIGAMYGASWIAGLHAFIEQRASNEDLRQEVRHAAARIAEANLGLRSPTDLLGPLLYSSVKSSREEDTVLKKKN